MKKIRSWFMKQHLFILSCIYISCAMQAAELPLSTIELAKQNYTSKFFFDDRGKIKESFITLLKDTGIKYKNSLTNKTLSLKKLRTEVAKPLGHGGWNITLLTQEKQDAYNQVETHQDFLEPLEKLGLIKNIYPSPTETYPNIFINCLELTQESCSQSLYRLFYLKKFLTEKNLQNFNIFMFHPGYTEHGIHQNVTLQQLPLLHLDLQTITLVQERCEQVELEESIVKKITPIRVMLPQSEKRAHAYTDIDLGVKKMITEFPKIEGNILLISTLSQGKKEEDIFSKALVESNCHDKSAGIYTAMIDDSFSSFTLLLETLTAILNKD